jgi:hypothetical protein
MTPATGPLASDAVTRAAGIAGRSRPGENKFCRGFTVVHSGGVLAGTAACTKKPGPAAQPHVLCGCSYQGPEQHSQQYSTFQLMTRAILPAYSVRRRPAFSDVGLILQAPPTASACAAGPGCRASPGHRGYAGSRRDPSGDVTSGLPQARSTPAGIGIDAYAMFRSAAGRCACACPESRPRLRTAEIFSRSPGRVTTEHLLSAPFSS